MVRRQLRDLPRVNAAIQNPDGSTSRKYVLYDIEEANRYTLSVGFGAELARFGGTTSNLIYQSIKKSRFSYVWPSYNCYNICHKILKAGALSP